MTDYTAITRELTINAPAEQISPWIVDFHKWVSWSPWEEIDPDLQRTYTGPDSGVGAMYEWSGNRKAGAGKMTITSVQPTGVDLDLDFTKPFKSASKTGFTFTPDAEGTTVVWQVRSPKTALTRIFGVFMNLEKMVGGDLERGLAKLKKTVES